MTLSKYLIKIKRRKKFKLDQPANLFIFLKIPQSWNELKILSYMCITNRNYEKLR